MLSNTKPRKLKLEVIPTKYNSLVVYVHPLNPQNIDECDLGKALTLPIVFRLGMMLTLRRKGAQALVETLVSIEGYISTASMYIDYAILVARPNDTLTGNVYARSGEALKLYKFALDYQDEDEVKVFSLDYEGNTVTGLAGYHLLPINTGDLKR